MDQQFRSLERSIPHRSSTYPLSERALSTSKWSPQHASSSPSKPHSPHFLASSSSVRSAHCPVKSVTGLATFQPPPTLSTSRTGPDPPLQLSAPGVQKRGSRERVRPGLRGGFTFLLLGRAGIAALEPGDLFWGQHYGASLDVGPELLARVAADEGEDLQRLVQGVGEGYLRNGQSILPGENAGAVQAPEVLLVAVGIDTDPVER